MASIPQCRAAIDSIAQRLAEVEESKRRELIVERTVAIFIRDLDASFALRLTPEGFADVRNGSAAADRSAQVRVTVRSDDLVALAEDRLGFAAAFLSGKVKVKASLSDMLRLRKVLR
jgi:predicted lipid carrier protein YhbT